MVSLSPLSVSFVILKAIQIVKPRLCQQIGISVRGFKQARLTKISSLILDSLNYILLEEVSDFES